MEQRPRRVSVTAREGPRAESKVAKEFRESIHEFFNCCDAETNCVHRKSLAFTDTVTRHSWTNISEIPKSMMPYAMEQAVDAPTGPESGDPGTRRGSRRGSLMTLPVILADKEEEDLDDFQRAVRCLRSDYKTFAATNFDRFIKENPNGTMEEIWPLMAQELRKTAALDEDTYDPELEELAIELPSFVESFHEPASKKVAIAVVELYNLGNEDGAREMLALIFELITSDKKEISMHWADCLIKLIEACKSIHVQKDIYPIILDKLAVKSAPSNAKVGACRLLRKLATRFNHEVVQKKIYPLMEVLARDKDSMVRAAAAINLPEIIHRMKDKNPVLKIITTMSQDTDQDVKSAITDTIVQAVVLTNAKDAKNKSFLESAMKTLKTLVKEAYVKGHIDLLVHFSACMGRCCLKFQQAGVLQPRDTLWYLDSFLQLSRFHANDKGEEDAMDDSMPAGFANFRANMEFTRRHSIMEALLGTKVQDQMEKESKHLKTTQAIAELRANAENRRMSVPFGGGPVLQPGGVGSLRPFGPDLERPHECRANAAKEFYEFMTFAQPIVDFRYGLHPLVTDLMHDLRPEVRAAMASKLLPIMEDLGVEAGLLHGELVYALSDDDLDVIQATVPNLAKMLRCLVYAKILSSENITPKLVEIGGAILFCEERLNQSTFYSVHQTLLEQFTVLPICFPGDYIYSNFVPSLFHRLRHMRQIPCRMAAANAIVIFLRHCRRALQREDIRKRIKEGLAQGRSVHDRMLFLYMAKKILEKFSRKYFREYFFDDVLQLAHDPVVNVRRKVLELLPELKPTAEDSSTQKKLEETLKIARKSEVDRDVKSVMDMVMQKIGNKAALEEGAGRNVPLMTFQKVRDPNDELKEKEELMMTTLESKAVKEEIDKMDAKQKRLSFYGVSSPRSST